MDQMDTKQAGHTPGPWRAIPSVWNGASTVWVDEGSFEIRDRRDFVLCTRTPWPNNAVQSSANGRLIAAAPELLQALEWESMFHPVPGECPNDRFERIALRIHADTGVLPPGKDSRTHSPEEQQAAKEKWLAEGFERTRAAIAKATGSAA